VTDGHEVHFKSTQEEYARRILTHVEAGHGQSQRSLARRTGIALGLTNIILKRLVARGWVCVSVVRPNRVQYSITPSGLVEQARMSCAYFARTTGLYAQTRDRIRDRLEALSLSWPTSSFLLHGRKPVAFYGATDVAEIAYVSLQRTDLAVTVVFDSDDTKHFFGATVRPLSSLAVRGEWVEFGVLAIMDFDDAARLRALEHLQSIGFPTDRVFLI
jgi:DNA-binding MarR family transcriptional regulator